MKHDVQSTKYLKSRGGWWHYVRRVPKCFAAIDDRDWIQVALLTQSLEIAMMRRDALSEADGALWNARALELSGGEPAGQAWKIADRRYQGAVARAMAMGFVYRPIHELATLPDIEEIVERLQAADKGKAPTEAKAEAMLGGAPEPEDKTTVSEAFGLYVSKIAFDDQYNKSDAQRRSWEKTKRTSIE
ncbi:MAG: hypothetical protein QNI84_04535 [Henriciella sp.]|nr:hypothetical protein [Henriciella sp.]